MRLKTLRAQYDGVGLGVSGESQGLGAGKGDLRLLIYGLNFSPELTGIGKYTGEMASWLAGRGHEVHVVTAPPYYPAWEVKAGHRNGFAVERPQENLTVYRCPLYVPAQPAGLNRMLHLASFAVSSLPVMLRESEWEPQVVMTVEPTFFGAPVALATASLSGARSWLHVQDFEVDAAFDLGLLPAKGVIHSLALGLERMFTTGFDRVSSISKKMVERALSKGVEASRCVLFPNWVDVDAVYPRPRCDGNVFREQMELRGKIVVLYSGNMGAKQGLESLPLLAEAFAADSRVHFVFCGDGAFRPRMEALVEGRTNVTLLPLQPMERLNELLNLADIHLLPQRAGAADLVMPSKLTGMLSSGRPVVATAEAGTQVAQVISAGPEHEACGMAVGAEDMDGLHRAVERLVNDEGLRERMGQAARRYAVLHLGREQVLAQFERHLFEAVGNV